MTKNAIAKEKETISLMIKLYCHDKHDSGERLCDNCAGLLQYAHQRLDKCPFGDEKGVCSQCRVHCYMPEMRQKILSGYAILRPEDDQEPPHPSNKTPLERKDTPKEKLKNLMPGDSVQFLVDRSPLSCNRQMEMIKKKTAAVAEPQSISHPNFRRRTNLRAFLLLKLWP